MSMSDPKSPKIPTLGWPANAGSYKDTPIDLSDPRASEPLVEISAYGIAGESYYARTDGGNTPYNRPIEGALPKIYMRKTVAEKLVAANAWLAPFGIEVFIFDAYRPVRCQAGIWEFFHELARQAKPNASDAERTDYVLNFASDPTGFDPQNPTTWPAHACGGAVDLTLRSIETKELLDMGTGFDEMSPHVYADAFERKLVRHEVALDNPALLHRRILHEAMTRQGFVNYPLEFWHFDYGDQMYAFHKRLLGHPDAPKAAWYGFVEAPAE